VLLSLVIGLAAFGLFAWRELNMQQPLLDLKVFKHGSFGLIAVINVAVAIIMYSDTMLLPIYLQQARGFSALESGFLLFPGALIMGLLMPATGKLFNRYGVKWLTIIGLLIVIATAFGYATLSTTTTYLFIMLITTVFRIGLAFMPMPIQTAGLNQLPTNLHPHGTAIISTIRQVAGALGIALLVTVMSNSSAAQYVSLLALELEGGYSEAMMLTTSTIAGVNAAYALIIGIGMIGLLLTLVIKQGVRSAHKNKGMDVKETTI